MTCAPANQGQGGDRSDQPAEASRQGEAGVPGRHGLRATDLFVFGVNRNQTDMQSAKWRLFGAFLLSLCVAVRGDTVKRVKEDQNVEFACNYPSTYQNPRIEWKFNSGQDTTLVYYNTGLTASYNDRAEFYLQGLLLKRVTRKDAGEYVCEVTDMSSGKVGYMEFKTQLVVLVPPSVPVARLPTSAAIGSSATMACVENDGSPRPTISWYKNKIKMPQDPKGSTIFQNTTYTIDPKTGDLTFPVLTPSDSAEYYCEASNDQGRQVSAAVFLETYERNVGGIVAAVIIVILILGLIAFGVWFAYSRGYIGKKTNKKVIYSQPSETRSDKNFQQTSSFVV